jgi:phage tail-like protein
MTLPTTSPVQETKPGGRRLLADLESRHSICSTLPSLYQEDELAGRFLSGLDKVLAPIFCTLDNLDAYFDAQLTPVDFLEWLSEWVGVVLDETWPLQRRRDLVGQAGELYLSRGTVWGLAALVAIYTGVEPEIVDSGGAAWSPIPGAALPGSPDHRVKIRLRIPKASAIERGRLERIVAMGKPAHVLHEIEVLDA